MRQAIVGKRFVDKLIQVHDRSGQEDLVLIHFEIQGDPQVNFSERLFEYYCLLYLRYKKPIIVLVILIDDDPNWHPKDYQKDVWGEIVNHFRFKTVKLLDYRGKTEALRDSDNPFAWITLVQLAAIDTKKNPQERLNIKIQLTRLLYQHKWTKEDIWNFYTFIDWVLILPQDFEFIYDCDIEQFEEEQGVAFITGMEQRGIEKGKQEGLRLGLEKGEKRGERKGEKKKALNIAKKMLSKRFDRSMIQELTDLSDEELDKLI